MCDLPPLGPAKDRPFCRLPPSPAHPVPPRASTAASKSADRGTFSRTWSPQKRRALSYQKRPLCVRGSDLNSAFLKAELSVRSPF